MLNAMDFECSQIKDSCKKKLLELINWLPKINRYLFSKLAILILSKKLSIYCSSQILGILKTRLDVSNQDSIDQSDYMMFLMHLLNGYSGFDLVNSEHRQDNSDLFYMDTPKFMNHVKLCHHLEDFINSHVNSDVIKEVLISSSLPILSQLSSVPSSTLYGTLCLISITNTNNSFQDLTSNWIFNSFLWSYVKNFQSRSNELRTETLNESELEILYKILNKIYSIFENDSKILIDMFTKIYEMLQGVNDAESIRKIFMLIIELIKRYPDKVKNSSQILFAIYDKYQQLNNSNYIWWFEFVNMLRTLKFTENA